MNTEIYDLGKIGITLGNEWNAEVNYEKLTFVFYKGDGYISVVNNKNVKPTDNNKVWFKAVEHGFSSYEQMIASGKFIGTEEEYLQMLTDVVNASPIVKQEIVRLNVAIDDANTIIDVLNNKAEEVDIISDKANAALNKTENVIDKIKNAEQAAINSSNSATNASESAAQAHASAVQAQTHLNTIQEQIENMTTPEGVVIPENVVAQVGNNKAKLSELNLLALNTESYISRHDAEFGANLFDGGRKDAYINEHGEEQEIANYKTSRYITVKEGEQYIFNILNNASGISCIWGYSGINRENPIPLVDTSSGQKDFVDFEITIPNGVNYIQAFTVYTTSHKQSIVKKFTIQNKINDISNTIYGYNKEPDESRSAYIGTDGVIHSHWNSSSFFFYGLKKGDVMIYASKGSGALLGKIRETTESDIFVTIKKNFAVENVEESGEYVVDEDGDYVINGIKDNLSCNVKKVGLNDVVGNFNLDTIPTIGNTNNAVSSDGLAKIFNNINTSIEATKSLTEENQVKATIALQDANDAKSNSTSALSASTTAVNALNSIKREIDNMQLPADVSSEVVAKLSMIPLKTTIIATAVALMQMDSLNKGEYVQTLGYYKEGDGGAGLFFITDTNTNDVLLRYNLPNGLYAECITDELVLPRYGGMFVNEMMENMKPFLRMHQRNKIVLPPPNSSHPACSYYVENGINVYFWKTSAPVLFGEECAYSDIYLNGEISADRHIEAVLKISDTRKPEDLCFMTPVRVSGWHYGGIDYAKLPDNGILIEGCARVNFVSSVQSGYAKNAFTIGGDGTNNTFEIQANLMEIGSYTEKGFVVDVHEKSCIFWINTLRIQNALQNDTIGIYMRGGFFQSYIGDIKITAPSASANSILATQTIFDIVSLSTNARENILTISAIRAGSNNKFGTIKNGTYSIGQINLAGNPSTVDPTIYIGGSEKETTSLHIDSIEAKDFNRNTGIINFDTNENSYLSINNSLIRIVSQYNTFVNGLCISDNVNLLRVHNGLHWNKTSGKLEVIKDNEIVATL